MPLLLLTEVQAQAAMEAADSDLKYLLSEVGVGIDDPSRGARGAQ